MLQLAGGGSERIVLELARHLDPEKFEIYIASFNGGELEDSFKEICKEIFFIKKYSGFDFSAMMKLANIVKNYRIDVINAHHYMPIFYSFFSAKIYNRIKLVYTEHSVPEVEVIAKSFHKLIFFFMLFQLDQVIGISGEISNKFKSEYSRHADKFYTVLNGVDIERFKVKEGREDIRRHWGVLNAHVVVGTVANFRKVKNHVCLVRAVSRLKDLHPNLRLIFVGTGFPGAPDNTELEIRALVHDLGLQDRVVMAGYQDDIPKVLSGFDVFCLPSFSEGLPVSLLEAMAAGVPIVGSQVKGIVEVVKHLETGLLFPADDDEGLAVMLNKLLSEPYLSRLMVHNALQYLEKNHACEAWITSYTEKFDIAHQ